jgi:hypothetical protein
MAAASIPAPQIARRALRLLDALLAPDGPRADRLDVEVALLLLAAHPDTTPAQWDRVRHRVHGEVEEVVAAADAVAHDRAALRGIGGVLRHGVGRGRRRRDADARAQEVCLRAGLLEGLTVLLNVLESGQRGLTPG